MAKGSKSTKDTGNAGFTHDEIPANARTHTDEGQEGVKLCTGVRRIVEEQFKKTMEATSTRTPK
jgi:hypothetical protein